MEKKEFKKIVAITLFESVVQWYCFLLYGTAAGIVFSKIFFVGLGDEKIALILSYLSFAVGYIAGPFGAIFFGNFGDKKGRKATMYASLLMMGISTFIIGILPSAKTSGVWVAIVLQVMRLAQCFGRGGTWGGGILMAYENVSEEKRAFYSAIPQLGLPIGLGISTLLLIIPNLILSNEQFFVWGWRIPFLIALVLTIIVARQKGKMMETEDYKKAQAKLEQAEKEGKKTKLGFVYMVKNYWVTLLLGCGTRWIDGTFYNVFLVWIVSYCVQWLKMPLVNVYIIIVAVCIFKLPLIYFGGWCAHKLGNAKTFVIASLVASITTIPALKVIENSNGNVVLITMAIVIGWAIAYDMMWAVISSLWSSCFETEVRYSGISFVYHVPSFLVAGLVPTICTILINYGNGNTIYVGLYTSVVGIISALSGYLLKKRQVNFQTK